MIQSHAYHENEQKPERFNKDMACVVNSVINNLPISDPKFKAISLCR